MFTLMCNIFIMCFALFLFVACFGWNCNVMGAASAAEAVAAAAVAADDDADAAAAAVVEAYISQSVVVVVVDIRSFLLYFPYRFTIQLGFLPYV